MLRQLNENGSVTVTDRSSSFENRKVVEYVTVKMPLAIYFQITPEEVLDLIDGYGSSQRREVHLYHDEKTVDRNMLIYLRVGQY